MSQPVVLIHGMWCTGANWARVCELLQSRGYACFAPTLPAHEPVADQPLHVGRCGMRDYLAFLIEAIRMQSFERRPVLIGHALGAVLAQQLAARIDALALVLLTPLAAHGLGGLRAANLAVFAPWLRSGALWRRPHKPSFQAAAHGLFNRMTPDRQRSLYETLVHESGRATFETLLPWADFTRAAAIRSDDVRCPVYVVSCGDDRLTPAAAARRVGARYAGVARRHYADRGHWVIDDEETEEMVHGICSWLRPFEQREALARHVR
ncbi:alpha/beta hydrolase [Sinimarinibacterium thermocellulolyticum]|uniref:Alpha/beta fold hydrolase n=1 Tax=Sinimarinibacterium thermocellulolyticum TaxID=3170016 RepID=A0ABV2ABA9_9GAMM